jgi:HD superfamily phosphodiesterase
MYIAHIREKDRAEQYLEDHLFEVSEIAKELAAKIGVPSPA